MILGFKPEWAAWGYKESAMFHYIDDKAFLKKAQNFCVEILNYLTQELLDYGISSQFLLVGSGGRNMVTQNADSPIDFDYNLHIQKCENINDCRAIKETVRKVFNKVLRDNKLPDCEDSTSSLTTKSIYFTDNPKILFSMDICIIFADNNGSWHRLIHKKTGCVSADTYYWNKAPNSRQIKEKADSIKENGYWQTVREEYLKIKNLYLRKNTEHPSFICYIEAVNNIYNKLRQKRKI